METSGRKTKLTDDMIEAIYTGLKNRMSWNQIASIVGVDPKTLRKLEASRRERKAGSLSEVFRYNPASRIGSKRGIKGGIAFSSF